MIGHDLLSNMGWPFEELVAYASRGAQVRAGDVLGSGTCGNGGCLAELWGRRGALDPPPLQPGDVVEMTVEGIGTIRNTVVAGIDLPPVHTGPGPVRRARNRLGLHATRRVTRDSGRITKGQLTCSSSSPATTSGTSASSPR